MRKVMVAVALIAFVCFVAFAGYAAWRATQGIWLESVELAAEVREFSPALAKRVAFLGLVAAGVPILGLVVILAVLTHAGETPETLRWYADVLERVRQRQRDERIRRFPTELPPRVAR